jgi:hypothetical protein
MVIALGHIIVASVNFAILGWPAAELINRSSIFVDWNEIWECYRKLADD